MNKNTKNQLFRIILLIAAGLVTGIGCTNKAAPVIAYMPDRIIYQFSDMQEHELVARAWIRRGFTLNNCRSIEIKPVTDASQTPQPAVAKRIHSGLQSIFNDELNKNGDFDLVLQAHLLDVKVKPGMIKSWFTEFDNMPYIEIEIVITDSTTGLPMAKIIHFRRDNKSLNAAVTGILDDLRQFFTTAL